MVRLLTTVNYKGEIIGPGIAYLDPEYEKLLVKNGNATFDVNTSKKEEQEEEHQEEQQDNKQQEEHQEDNTDQKEQKPKTRRRAEAK